MTSSSCSVCGSTQTKVMDGLMYCEICGTQIFDFREIEAEDEGTMVMSRAKVARRKTREVLDKSRTDADAAALGLATASSRKKRKGEKLEWITATASTKTLNQPNELVRDVTTGREHAPGYLRRIGCRISTFTKMLAKGVAMIRQDAAVPHDFSDHVLAVYQRYLAACNVAFTSVDYTEDLEVMFRALVLNTNIAFERAQEKKEKKALKKTRGKEALEKSTTAWELLMSDTLNENLEMQSDDEQEEEFNSEMPTTSEAPKKPRMVTVVDTKIPKEALQNASAILLSVDSLAAILYVSVVTIGCRWILLSDILRWMREGRFGITLFQLTALVPRALEKIEKTGKSPYTKLNFPLHEFLRTALFVWQLCRLPPIPVKVDFEQAVARLLYHLNLPEVLMEHVLLLIEKARPCTDLDGEALRRQGRMEQGPFSRGFSFDPRDRKKKTFMLTAFGRPRPTKTNRNSDIFFSTETKALAFILMALKLCFGLDDVREYRVNKENENSTATRFTFIQWFYQLKMRIMLWEGHDPLEILQMNKPVDPLLYEEDFPGGRLLYDDYNYNITSDEGKRGYFIRYWHRDARFSHCIPTSIRIDSSTSIPNPFPEDTYDVQPNMNDDESLYTPLRRQTNVLRTYLMRSRTAEEKQELNGAVDEAAVRIFKTEFSKSSLTSDPSSSGSGAQQTDNSSAQRSRWQSCFPCAKGYVRYPRPRFTNAGVLQVREDDVRVKKFNKKMGLCSTSSGIRLLFASRKAAVDALEAAKPTMSHTFAMLLKWFSKIIGESDFVLYAAFVMLEYQIVDRARFDQLKQFMLDGRVHELKSTAINRQGERSFMTLYVSPAEDISEASQIEEVRIGLPRNWAMVEASFADDSVEELDFSSDSSSEEDDDSDDSSEEEEEQRPSAKGTLSDSLPRDALDQSAPATMPLNTSAPNGAAAVRMTRELSNYQRHIRAYEFDIIWMLITMRYW